MCVGVSLWLGWSGIRVAVVLQPATRIPLQPNHTETPNTHRTKNNTTNVVIQQNSRKLLVMDVLMSETCWAHKKWNKIASDIKLVFYSSTITMMHGPINISNIIYLNIKNVSLSEFLTPSSLVTFLPRMLLLLSEESSPSPLLACSQWRCINPPPKTSYFPQLSLYPSRGLLACIGFSGFATISSGWYNEGYKMDREYSTYDGQENSRRVWWGKI